jgi:hypothetical protein
MENAIAYGNVHLEDGISEGRMKGGESQGTEL